MRHGGTRVRVELFQAPGAGGGVFWSENLHYAFSLGEIVSWLCLASDVDLYADEAKGRPIVKGNDWQTIPPRALLSRTHLVPSPDRKAFDVFASKIAPNLRLISRPSGETVGRIAIIPSPYNSAKLNRPGTRNQSGLPPRIDTLPPCYVNVSALTQGRARAGRAETTFG